MKKRYIVISSIVFISVLILSRIVLGTDLSQRNRINAKVLSATLTTEDGNYSYIVLTDGTVEISKYKGTEETVIIPETINGKKVTSLGLYSFTNCTTIIKLKIPQYVSNIEDPVFTTSKLQTIEVDEKNTVYTSIDGVLYNKDKTKLVRYPIAKEGTFYTISSTVKEIGREAFAYCTKLTQIIIPEEVNKIGARAFASCKGLPQITLPKEIKKLEAGIFEGCTALENIVIPKNVQTIETNAFSACEKLKNVEMDNGITEIKDMAFQGCKVLNNVVIPKTVTTMGGNLFFNSIGLENITIPNTVTSIGKNAFSYNEQIEGSIFFTTQVMKQVNIICAENSVAKQYAMDNNIKYTVQTLPAIEGIQDEKIYMGAIKPTIIQTNLTKIELYKGFYERVSVIENFPEQITEYVGQEKIDSYKINETILTEAGKYLLEIEDTVGNKKTIKYAILPNNYKVDNQKNVIYRISPNTNVDSLKEIIELSRIYYGERELIKTDNLVTGSEIQTNGLNNYTLIVTGDVNYDGEVTVTDLLNVKKQLVGLIQLEDIELIAADINDDTKITITDILKIKRNIVGLEEL